MSDQRDYKLEKKFRDNCRNLMVYKLPKWDEIPEINLYMDQLVTLLEKYLAPYQIEKEEKMITKAMINNYVKDEIIPKPVNKKYNKEHVAYLLVICMLKSTVSISNIKSIIKCQKEYRSAEELLNLVDDILELSADFFINKVTLKVESLLQTDQNSDLVFTSLAITMGLISNTSKMVSEISLKTRKEAKGEEV